MLALCFLELWKQKARQKAEGDSQMLTTGGAVPTLGPAWREEGERGAIRALGKADLVPGHRNNANVTIKHIIH